LLDVGLAAVLATLGALDALHGGDWPQPHAASAALAAFSGICLAWRRRRPLLSYAGVVTGLVVANVALGHYEAGSALLIVLVAAYSVAAHEGDVRSGLAISAVLVVSFGVEEPPGEAIGDMLFSASVVALSYGVGLSIRALRRRTIALRTEQAAAAAEAAESERRRIARELHDIISHGLGLVVLQAGVADRVLDRDPNRAREALQQIRETGQEALGELSTLVGLIRDDGRTPAEPQPTLADLDRLVAGTRAAGLDVEVRSEGTARLLPPAVELSAYRVVQEGLTNALKHAGRARITVVLGYRDDGLDVEVRDDGGGARAGAGGRHGLSGLRERVTVFGGRFEAGSRPEGGWRVRASFPTAP
jgi:signal transduction histidine kinase